MARVKARSNQEFMASIETAFRVAFWIGLFSSVLTALGAEHLTKLLFGASYLPAAKVLVILAFTNIFICMGVAQNLWLVNEGLGRVALYRTCIGAIISLLLNYLFVGKYGLEAAAIAAVVSQACSTVLSNLLFAPKILRLQLRSMLFMPSKYAV